MHGVKRNADDAGLDVGLQRAGRAMQGDGGDGKKHSLDSDEELDANEDNESQRIDEDDIDGQEDGTVADDEGVKITPFNLKEEHEEGHFSKEGDFVWKKEKEAHDAWLDNVDWVKVKKFSKNEDKLRDASDEAEDKAEAAYDESKAYKAILSLLKPGETVAKAIRRLGSQSGGAKASQQRERKIAQKLKKGVALSADEEAFKSGRAEMARLTGLADSVLTRSGNMEIYEETYEKIAYRMGKTHIPDDVGDDDDALDMFAGRLDAEKPPTSSTFNLDEKVEWEYKFGEGPVKGPLSSEEMLSKQEKGEFDGDGFVVRKVGSKDFLDGRRVDFDLYT